MPLTPKSRPVIAAIPNYNMADSLAQLLPQVREQRYDAIYVLDDASTDNSRAVMRRFGSDVHLIAGQQNVGPGANRNRILDIVADEALVHFFDADVRLISARNPETLRAVFARQPQTAVVGGLVQLPNGTPWMFNYGPRYSIFSDIAGWSQAVTHGLDLQPWVRNAVDRLSRWRHPSFPDITLPPRARHVFWVSEANFCIPLSIFREVGGFDPTLRYHETQDLAYKLQRHSYDTWFDPAIAVAHPAIDLSDKGRHARQRKADWQLIRKYGLHLK